MLKDRLSIFGMNLSEYILSPVFCDCPLKCYIKVPIESVIRVGGRTARWRVRRPGSAGTDFRG
jgi:hypothetical protein